MNIIVIVIDTLRYDYVSANGNDWIHTPNMDKLATKSWVFNHCYSASYPTIPHRTDAITGRYGSPFHPWKPLDFNVPTLPRALAEAGYCTQLIHDTPHLVNGGHNFDWPFHAWTFIRGAEVDRPWIDSLPVLPEDHPRDPLFDFIDENLLKSSNYITYFRANRNRKKEEDWNTAKLFLTASQWLKDNASRDNFFLWIDCFDPHEPWDVPPRFVKMYDKTPHYDGRIDPRALWAYIWADKNGKIIPKMAGDRLKAFYAAKVSWVDRWLGEFLDTLEQTGLAKNTAVLLTADHGTNVGERSRFGKDWTVREQEGHIPLIIHTPDGGNGYSDIIVQPQDIFATVMGIAGLPIPGSLDSHNVLDITRKDKEGPRKLALSGRAADCWWKDDPKKALLTIFDSEQYLELTARPENCHLTRYGSLEDVATENQSVVERLYRSAIDEIERRGADHSLVSWLKNEGKSKFPEECRFWDGWPGPKGYTVYFRRLYKKP